MVVALTLHVRDPVLDVLGVLAVGTSLGAVLETDLPGDRERDSSQMSLNGARCHVKCLRKDLRIFLFRSRLSFAATVLGLESNRGRKTDGERKKKEIKGIEGASWGKEGNCVHCW